MIADKERLIPERSQAIKKFEEILKATTKWPMKSANPHLAPTPEMWDYMKKSFLGKFVWEMDDMDSIRIYVERKCKNLITRKLNIYTCYGGGKHVVITTDNDILKLKTDIKKNGLKPFIYNDKNGEIVCFQKRLRQVRDALNKTKDIECIEKCAKILGV